MSIKDLCPHCQQNKPLHDSVVRTILGPKGVRVCAECLAKLIEKQKKSDD